MIEHWRATANPKPRADLTTVAELLETLRHARAAVGHELEAALEASTRKGEQLRRLQQSLRSFGSFADRLLVLMCDRGLDGPLMEEAEQLYDFFHGLEAEVVDRLPVGEV